MLKNRKVILCVISIVLILIIVIIGIKYRSDDSKLSESVLVCEKYECNETVYSGRKILYMFLDNYNDYKEYRDKYTKTYSEFSDGIKDYDEDFFKKYKLVVFEKMSCSLDEVKYEGTEAIIGYTSTDCAYQFGEIDLVEVKKNTKNIRFENKD